MKFKPCLIYYADHANSDNSAELFLEVNVIFEAVNSYEACDIVFDYFTTQIGFLPGKNVEKVAGRGKEIVCDDKIYYAGFTRTQ